MPSPWVQRALNNELEAKELTSYAPASPFPGGLVLQRNRTDDGTGDCFTACVATLTGIDIDLLPVLPPRVDVSVPPDGWMHVRLDGDRWQTWAELMADNGFIFQVYTEILPYTMGIIGLVNIYTQRAHAVAVDTRNRIWEPTQGKMMALTDMLSMGWVPATFTTIRER